MPVKVNLVDNASQVKVKPKSTDGINLKHDCGLINSPLAYRLDKEIEHRIEGDEHLQQQLDNKQDKIEFIILNSLEGYIPHDDLRLLLTNKINRLVYQDTIYYLATIDNNTRKYFSRKASSVYNEIDVTITTGAFKIISTIDPIVKEHIEDNTIHITETERIFWNDKISVDVEENPSDTDYTLVLKKD